MENVKFQSVTIVKGGGPDKLFFHSEILEGCYPFKKGADFTVSCGADMGEAWVKKNFPNLPIKLLVERS